MVCRAAFFLLSLFFTLLLGGRHVLAAPAPNPESTRAPVVNSGTCSKPISILDVAYYTDMSAKIRGDDGTICAAKPARRALKAPPRNSQAHSAPISPVGGQGLSGLTRRDDYSCGENDPCPNSACCGKNGYCGFGDEYCGTNGESPNDACWSNCDATAECGINAAVANTTCPLNVCCSQYGFCGTTDLFCLESEGCQSNCGEPESSGETDGDVQSRIIGYYEAWKYESTCSAVSLKNLPVGSLTHLHIAFGYIAPDTFEISMMDGVPDSVIDKITQLKDTNPAINMVISLGGWSFNDNDTTTQPVFGDMVSSKSKRATFITNLFAFLDHYGLDGVDFDWEYPGAPDRGGNDDDGENYATFLKELDDVNSERAKKTIVSFTAPTSYWYLQYMELTDMMDYVDYVNLMAYDLHGTWDGPEDQVGSIVLAHTNLTEIQNSLSLMWRNDVDPSKINLGIGFYGRSFNLTDPNCFQPGCPFQGGAAKGVCSGESGILSYDEITNIIDQYDVDPIWDKDAAVKYVVWGGNSWVSYDDKDTFQQKVEYANNQGLGGLLIWAIDQDTSELDALQGLIYPKTLNAFVDDTVNDYEYWQSSSEGVCRLTDCGNKCVAGEVLITSQKCGDSTSQLCCPLAAAPDPDDCTWRGNPPSCNGHCQDGEVPMEQNKWGGGGDSCSDGNKVYCCKSPKATGCRTTGCGGDCNSDEESIAGEFFDNCFLQPKKLCCEKPVGFSDCYWQGKDGSCYDNNCKFGTEIQLAESYDGGGENCGYQLSRQRVFCCTPPDGESPFLPVELDYLFPNPPTGDDVDTDFKLETDDTYGGKYDEDDDTEPNDSTFGFVILASPDTIQTSLDKRDGSHWDVYNCEDAVTDGEHTVQMVCTDDSADSNCYKIGLGSGVPGTILELPKHCGPMRYAVAKDMRPAASQEIPHRIVKRSGLSASKKHVVYDLTFDYDFARVRRDSGEETQVRIDYSNEEGYWDAIVDKAADKKRRRARSLDSLPDFDGDHQLWLEHAWAEDHKGGLLTREELHARWFGSDILDWLQGLFSVAEAAPSVTHSVSETLSVLLLQEQYSCNLGGVDVEAKLNVQADLDLTIDTSFGLTIITTMGVLPDLSQSYMYFRNKGKVEAVFSIDALAQASYDTGDIELFGLQNFNALFSVYGIVTVGPNFKLFGSVNMDVSLSGSFEAAVTLADWDTQVSFPDPGTSSDYDPQDLKTAEDKTQPGDASFDWSVQAEGQITAHLKPQASFGITWGSVFSSLGNCEVDLVLDGYMQAYVRAGASGGSSTDTSASVCYGANTGADLYVKLDAPDQFNWILANNPWSLGSWGPVPVIDETCPISTSSKRTIHPGGGGSELAQLRSSKKRDTTVIGPLLYLPFGLSCPDQSGNATSEIVSCPLCSSSDDSTASKRWLYGSNDTDLITDSLLARDNDGDGGTCVYYPFAETACPASGASARSLIEKRDKKTWDYTDSTGMGWTFESSTFPNCGKAVNNAGISKWYGYDAAQSSSNLACVPSTFKQNDGTEAYFDQSDYVTEHVFEWQTYVQFVDWLRGGSGPAAPTGYTMPSQAWVELYIMGVPRTTGLHMNTARLGGDTTDSWSYLDYCIRGLGGTSNTQQLVLADGKMNRQKETFFSMHSPGVDKSTAEATMIYAKNVAAVFTYLNYIPPTTNTVDEAIWNKFMRSSNWIDLVSADFQTRYLALRTAAGGGAAGSYGEPVYTDPTTNVKSVGNMRWLWKTFIDASLATIEVNARSYCTAVSQYFVASTANPSPKYLIATGSSANAAWATSAFGAGGWCASPRLPRPQGGGGLYGAYAYPAYTVDANGATVTLGNPTP